MSSFQLINGYKSCFSGIIIIMNKIGNQRYASYSEVPRFQQDLKQAYRARNLHAASMLAQKEYQIDLVKKRISALCVREQKYTHRTINTQKQLQKKESVQLESQRIQRLLEQQREKEAKKKEILKNRNLQTRVENYYRTKSIRDQKLRQAWANSSVIRSRSKQFARAIAQQKQGSISVKRERKREIYDGEISAREGRSRVLLAKREEVLSREKREADHIGKLKEIKDHQLSQLSKLQLIMVEKNNTSRAAYQSSRQRLAYKNNYQTHQVIRTARQRSHDKHNISLNFY